MTDKRKRRGPRGPYKLKPEVEETILRHLRTGAFQVHAAEAAGIEWRTFKNWLDLGDEGVKPYAAFTIKVRQLQAEDAIRSQAVITRAQLGRIDGDWRAAAWSLERKYPKIYGLAAMHAAAAVTVRGGVAGGATNDDSVTTVQFYLPDNGRRPQDEGEDSGEGSED
jgi:hypothetical protein